MNITHRARSLALWHLKSVLENGHEEAPVVGPGDVLVLRYPESYGLTEPILLEVYFSQVCSPPNHGLIVAAATFDGDLDNVREHPTRCVWEVQSDG